MNVFIALEGTDGAGKTGLRKHLFAALRERSVDIVSIIPFSWRDLEAAETIVEAKFHDMPIPPDQITRAYVRDKESLSRRLIEPQLVYRSVVSDRFAASDIVYHELLWGTDPDRTYDAFRASTVRPPDHTFFIDTPPQVAFDRANKRGTGGGHRWDKLDKQRRLYASFQDVLFSDRYPWLGPVTRIDNAGAFEHAANALVSAALALIGNPAAS